METNTKTNTNRHNIGDYSIGGLDAWTDDFGIIKDVFIPIQQFARLLERDGCFLCGRRGSGKSALGIMSTGSPMWDCYEVIEGEKSQYGAYMELVDGLMERINTGLQIDIKKSIYLLWRYILRVVIIQTIAKNTSSMGIDDDDKILQMKNFLKNFHLWEKSIGDILHDAFQTATAMIREDGQGVANFYASLRNVCSHPELQKSISNIPAVLGRKKILLILDTLESYKIHHEAMKQGLRGVITAILGLLGDPNLQKTSIRFFIPAEIFEDVSGEIPAKTMSRAVFLRWQSGDLFTMASKRYIDMLERTSLIHTDKAKILRGLVDEALDKTISGGDGRMLRKKFWYENKFLPARITNRNGVEEDCFAYILRHTQRRPRELVWVLNQIIRKAFSNKELPELSAKSVIDGLHERTTLQLLLSDALSPYEGYVDKIVDRARATLYGQPRIMFGSDLKRFAKSFYEFGPAPEIGPDQFVQFLLRSGVIGLIKNPEKCASSKHIYCTAMFEYLMQDHIAFNSRQLYCVHPVLGDFFDMEQDKKVGVVYPKPEDENWLEDELGISW